MVGLRRSRLLIIVIGIVVDDLSRGIPDDVGHECRAAHERKSQDQSAGDGCAVLQRPFSLVIFSMSEILFGCARWLQRFAIRIVRCPSVSAIPKTLAHWLARHEAQVCRGS